MNFVLEAAAGAAASGDGAGAGTGADAEPGCWGVENIIVYSLGPCPVGAGGAKPPRPCAENAPVAVPPKGAEGEGAIGGPAGAQPGMSAFPKI